MDAKLIAARAEIEAVLAKHDIAAHVVLHNAPGNFELFMRLTPGYSKLAQEGADQHGLKFRLRSKLADYHGDTEAQARDLAATANMVHGFASLLFEAALPMLSLAEVVNKATNAEHGAFMRSEGRPQ